MESEKYILRTATIEDIPAITSMYKETVRSVNAKDYTAGQISVWAEGAENLPRWESAIADQYFIVAEEHTTPVLKPDPSLKKEGSKIIAGFASLAKDGYLDFMYVNKDYQHKGIASLLLDEIEKKANEQNNRKIYSHVSKTAKGFFIKKGYEHSKDIEDIYSGELFINALMIKKLN